MWAPLLVLLMGCPPKVPEGLGPDVLEAAPVLPSPRAGTYARVASTPPDPVVAELVRDLRWDSSLSGAAAGTAMLAVQLGDPALARWRVREALWQAGYPYPVHTAGLWESPHASPAPPGVEAWLARRTADEDVGLVRMRGRASDLWVGLAASPRAALDPLPRSTEGPITLVLPANPGMHWRLGDPLGRATTGELDGGTRLPLDQAGEWLLEIHDSHGIAASAPVYVATPVPETSLLDWPEPAEGAASVAVELARVRDVYGAPAPTRDPTLEQAAARWLDEGEDPVPFAERFGVLEPRPLVCTAGTIEDCFDQLAWSVEGREALLDDTLDLYGLAVRPGQPTRMALVLGRSP